MRYRTRTGKELGDRSIMTDVSKGFSDAAKKEAPIVTQFVSSIIAYIIGALAFLTKSFLRLKLGERTFGLFNLLLSVALIYFVYLFTQLYSDLLVEFYDESIRNNLGVKFFAFLQTFFYLAMALWQMDKSGDIYLEDGKLAYSLDLVLPEELKYFMWIIVIIGLTHLIDVYIRRANKEVIHSFYRGDSVFWGWLRGRTIGPLTFNDTRIWMFVEPAFVLVIAYLIHSVWGFTELSSLLMVSAICLFIEEYKVYIETRRFTLDMLDGRLDAAFMSSVQEEYKASLEGEKESSAKSYQASIGGTARGFQEAKGSTSKFRAKLL